MNHCGHFGLLFTFAIFPVTSDMRLHMNGFTILYSIIARNTIELSSFLVFCHMHLYLSFSRGLYLLPPISTVMQS